MVQKLFTIKVGGKAPVDLFWIKLNYLMGGKKGGGGRVKNFFFKKARGGQFLHVYVISLIYHDIMLIPKYMYLIINHCKLYIYIHIYSIHANQLYMLVISKYIVFYVFQTYKRPFIMIIVKYTQPLHILASTLPLQYTHYLVY